MFLDQIISADGLYLRTWKDLQQDNNLNCKYGRPPKWYKYLQDKFTPYTPSCNNYRLNFKLETPIISSCFAPRFPTAPKSHVLHNHRFKWVAFWNDSKKEIEYAKVIHSANRPHDKPTLYLEHYIISYSVANNTSPASINHELIKCNECQLNNPFYITTKYVPKCALVSYNQHCITVKINNQRKKYFTTRYNTDRINAFNDFLQRQFPLNTSRLQLNLQSNNHFISTIINGPVHLIRQLN